MTKNAETTALNRLVNAFLPDGTWVGMFMDAETARAWLKSQGHDAAKCEISKRRPERKHREEADAGSS